MKIDRPLSIFLLASLLAAPLAYGGEHQLPYSQEANYLTPSALPPQLLPTPLQESNEANRAEIDAVVAAQKDLSAGEKAAMRNEQNPTLDLITQLISPSFIPSNYPRSFLLLNRVVQDTGAIVENDKLFWHKRRPYLVDSRVQLFVDPINGSPAYPSGHTCGMRVLAEVLGMLFPEKLDALRDRAASIAHHRIEAGVHYPSDIEGGEMLAMLIVGSLLQNPKFEHDLEAARHEVASSGR